MGVRITAPTKFQSTTFGHWPAAGAIANNLSARLWLRGRSLDLLTLRVPLRHILTRGDRLLVLGLLAFIIVVDAITSPTCDLHAGIAIGLETVIADQRADPPWLGLDRIERIEARKRRVELRSRILVEQRQGAL